MDRYFLSVVQDGIQVIRNGDNIGGPVISGKDLVGRMESTGFDDAKDIVMFSSSMGFPYEYTDDARVIDLVERIMSVS